MASIDHILAYVRYGIPPCHGWCWATEISLDRDTESVATDLFDPPDCWELRIPSPIVRVTITPRCPPETRIPMLTYQEWPRLTRPSYVRRPLPLNAELPLLIEMYAQRSGETYKERLETERAFFSELHLGQFTFTTSRALTACES